MWTRIELKWKAREAFDKCKWTAIIICFIFTFLCANGTGSMVRGVEVNDNGVSLNNKELNLGIPNDFIPAVVFSIAMMALCIMVVSLIIKLFVGYPIEIGTRRYFYLSLNRDDLKVRDITYSFSNGYVDGIVTLFLRDLKIFLWTILFIIPGIVKRYEYRMVPYIIAETPEIDRKEAFEISRRMMDGEKWDTFVLDLSFIPWDILSLITFGIVGTFYTLPYYNFTHAAQYEALKEKMINEDIKRTIYVDAYKEI